MYEKQNSKGLRGAKNLVSSGIGGRSLALDVSKGTWIGGDVKWKEDRSEPAGCIREREPKSQGELFRGVTQKKLGLQLAGPGRCHTG